MVRITNRSKLFDGVDVLMPKNIMGFGSLGFSYTRSCYSGFGRI